MKRSSSLQFSLRTLLLVLMPLAAVLALTVRWTEPHFVRTGNPFDLAIEGGGYFCIADEFRENHRYTRGGQLTVNANGLLSLRLDGADRALEPAIPIPADSQDLREVLKIAADGRVYSEIDGSEQQHGQLIMYTFAAANLPQFKQLTFAADKETGPPFEWIPATGPAGYSRQGYRECPSWRWDTDSVYLLLTGFTLGVLATWSSCGTRFKTATASPGPSSESPSAP